MVSAHNQAEIWAATHASVFATKKYELTHFSRSPTSFNMECGITLASHDIRPSRSCCFLGVRLDQKLTGKDHISHILVNGTKSLAALTSIAGSTWGIPTLGLRQIYRSIILPRALCYCSVWALGNNVNKDIESKLKNVIERIQSRAARIIAGAYRATSKAALDIELFLLPVA